MSIIPIELKALTDIWTGGVGSKDGSKLHLTGLKGSIRWWYEALVRGLGGYACDPRYDPKEESEKKYKRCELDPKKVKDGFKAGKQLDKILDEEKVCPVCRVFGCTGLGAKVRLAIKDRKIEKNGKYEIINDDSAIKKGQLFTLEFIPLRPISQDEKKLLNATIKLIVEYGAIGGKTSLKPSEPAPAKPKGNNSKLHHTDYGIIGYQDKPVPLLTEVEAKCLLEEMREQLKKMPTPVPDDWPDLKNFWFVKGKHLNRKQINELVSRDATSGKYVNTASAFQIFLGGFTPKDKERVGITIHYCPVKIA